MTQVQATQDQMRQELERYLNEVRSRTDVDGKALVDFPDTFDADAQSEADRKSSWRKFISSRVMEHPDEAVDREQRVKMYDLMHAMYCMHQAPGPPYTPAPVCFFPCSSAPPPTLP